MASESIYGLGDNNTGRTVVVEIGIEWDQNDFLSINITDDETGDEIVSIVSGDDGDAKINEFFDSVERVKARWQERRAG